MSKRIILAGGGTGGHIYPAIAIATAIEQNIPNARILFVGSEHGMEKDLVPKAGFQLETIRIKGFRRKLSLDTFATIKELALGMMASWRIISREKPDLVIGTGGYVAGPVLFLASLIGIKTLIHEQNVKPGVTNKILSRFVDRIAISFEESYKYFPRHKTIISGNPVRPQIASGDRYKALKEFGLDTQKPVVLCFGGSQGASKLNDAMIEVIDKIKDNDRYQIIHITGKGQHTRVMGQLEDKGILPKTLGHIKILPYIYDMQNAYAASDLVISRAGALTVSEISMCGKPSILVPLPTAAGNHQQYNAKFLEDHGAASIIPDKSLTGEVLRRAIEDIIFDEKKRTEMSLASKKLAKFDALKIIFQQVEELLRS